MKYFLFSKQNSDGCDYSINCGEQLQLLNAKTKEEAIAEIVGVPDCWKDFATNEAEFHDFLCDCGVKRYLYQDEFKLKKCVLLEVVEETNMFPFLQEKMKEIDDYIADLETKKHVDAERLEYQRLKKKFEK